MFNCPSAHAKPRAEVSHREMTGRAAPIRVASIPGKHQYVQHCLAETDSAVSILDDPIPDPAYPERWWPPLMLSTEWIEKNHDEFDVMHIHFGFESFTPRHLTDVMESLRNHGIPLVVTVHDLQNPHVTDHQAHIEAVGVLVHHASALVTLTPGAASEIDQRWGRTAQVIPHPHIAPLPMIGRARTKEVGAPKSVRAFGASGRPNVDQAILKVLTEMQRDGCQFGVTTERLSDIDLYELLVSTDVVVLPHRWGTHSGWIELCRDFGVRVAVPDCGYFSDQFDDPDAFEVYRSGDPQTMMSAVTRLLEKPGRAPVPERTRQRARIAHDIEAVYARVL